jgi:hypothetical protein
MKDAGISYRPINKTAGIVLSKGIDWEFKYNPSASLEWEERPDTVPVPMNKCLFIDLTGMICDRVTIIGLYKSCSHRHQKGQSWVGRCVCGKFVLRRSRSFIKAIKKGNPNMCQRCNHIKRMQTGYVKKIKV